MPRRPAIAFIFVTLLMDVLGFGLLIPVAPRLVMSLIEQNAGVETMPAPGTPAYAVLEGQAAGYVGWLAATYAAMQFFFAPVLGSLSDRFGRRPVLLISIFGSALDYVAMALAPSLAFLFITRAINGISGASMSVCSAYIADVTPPEKRAAGFGIIGAAFGLGFILGPLMGGFLGDINIHYPFYAAAGIAALNWLYGLFVLPESLAPEHRSHLKLSRMNPLSVLDKLARYPMVLGMAGALFLLNLAMFGLHATWVLYTGHRYGWSSFDVGLSLTLVGIGAAVVQGGLARWIIPRLGVGAIGERRAVIIGFAIAAAAYFGYGASPQGWMIYAIIVVASLGGIAQPAAQALITKSVRADEQGAIQGALSACQSIANIVGPLLGTAVFQYAISGRAAEPWNQPGLSFFVGCVLAVLGTVAAAYVTGGDVTRRLNAARDESRAEAEARASRTPRTTSE